MLLIVLFTSYLVWRSSRALNKATIMMHDALNAPGYGLVFFDDKSRYYAMNTQAREKLPFLNGKDNKFKLQNFLDFMYDNAINLDESLKVTIEKSVLHLAGLEESFREVILLEDDRLCLIITQKTEAGHTIFLLIDVSEQWRNEEDYWMMGEKNYQLHLAVESANIGVVISMPKYVGNPISFCNTAATQITGVERSDIIHGFWHQLIQVFEEDNLDDKITAAFMEGKPVEISLTKKRGATTQWFSLTITPVLDNKGQPDLYIGVFKDTTDLKIKEAEFFQSQKLEALGQLSAGISHDFNNILSVIDGFSSLAEKQLPEGADISAEYMRRVRAATQRGSSLIKRMMTFGRKKSSANSVFELSKMVQEQEILLMTLLSPSVKMFMEVAAGNLNIECSPDSISQIVMNLVINARDAIGDDSGVISIKLGRVDSDGLAQALKDKLAANDYASLSIADTGCGMSEATLQKIFDPFFTTKTVEKGTGLGMSVVYGLVKEMQGHVDIKSEEGRGTNITVFLPLTTRTPTRKVSGNLDAIHSVRLNGYTAMIVDGQADCLDATASMLRKAGMAVIEACDRDDALVKQDDFKGEIDILLIDLMTPKMQGVKLAALFRSIRPAAKVIYISGCISSDDAQFIVVPQGEIFIAKPVVYEQLIETLYRALQNDNASQCSADAAEHSLK